jgi:hypothetical protein
MDGGQMVIGGPSLHCSWSELSCRDQGQTPYPKTWIDRAIALASEFESIREACARFLAVDEAPIDIISAYRTQAQNAKVGGVGASQHLFGRALDLAPPRGMTLDDFEAICVDQANRRGIIRGIGVYPNDGHLHIDLRPEVALARWRG